MNQTFTDYLKCQFLLIFNLNRPSYFKCQLFKDHGSWLSLPHDYI